MAGLRRLALLILFTSLLTQLLVGQQPDNAVPGGPCAMPSFSKIVNEPNIFTEQQEEWLGDIMDQGIRDEFNVVEDPEGYLQKLGERLLAQLPPTVIHYHFVIVDAPDLNSFGVAGGRIYIHRRMIAFTRNEGELAALLGHEIGHAATHQVAIQMTGWLRSLGVTSIGDRQDVIHKWNLFKDNAAKIKEHGGASRERDEQFIADRVGLYAMTRAGYGPAQFVEFADRSLETKGKTGGFWSDFFGTTSFGAKRLREIMRNSTPLPANCIAPFTADAGHFAKWQQDVIASRRVMAKEELPGLLKKTSLQPQLRGDIYNIEFSGDGKYLLAQDASSVFVMGREPLANIFRIDAIDAHMAQFSPDSNAVVFYDKELRVEKWDIATQQRTALHALTVPDCYQTSLSPSGEYMACVQMNRDYEFSLQLIEVNTNRTIYTRAKFYTPYWSEMFAIYLSRIFEVPGHTFELRFSPDSRYFLVGHQTAALAYDLQSKAEVHLPSRIRDLMKFTFAFISPEEIAGTEYSGGSNKLVRCRFPSGEKNDEFKLQTYGRLFSTSQSSYMLIRPAGAYPVGIIDLNKKTISQGFRSTGFAVYGQIFAGEQTSGEVALFSSADQKRIGKVQLPDSPLAGSKASSFSPDGKWLAVSGDTRGALWQLDTGERIFFTHAFEGAFFDQGQLVAKFAQKEPDPSRVFQLDPVSKGTKKLYDLDLKEHRATQQGELLIRFRPEKEGPQEKVSLSGNFGPGDLFFRGNSILEVRDVRTNVVLWERKMGKSLPRFFYDGNVLTLVVGNFDNIKEAAKEDPKLNAVLNTIDGKRDVYMLQAFEAKTGKLLGNVIVDTGKLSFKVEWAVTVGDTMLVADSIDRTLVYSLQSGQQKGKILGHLRAATPDGSRMLIELNRGIVEVYDTATLQPVNHLSFPSRISYAQFTGDGKILMVLTADQNVYQLDLKASQQTASATK